MSDNFVSPSKIASVSAHFAERACKLHVTALVAVCYVSLNSSAHHVSAAEDNVGIFLHSNIKNEISFKQIS
jgi:hypothetical protein